MRIPKNRLPTHPGEMLLEEFLKPMGVTQTRLARHIGVQINRVNEIVNGRRGITASTARRLSAALGTTAELWMNLQAAYDLARDQAKEPELKVTQMSEAVPA